MWAPGLSDIFCQTRKHTALGIRFSDLAQRLKFRRLSTGRSPRAVEEILAPSFGTLPLTGPLWSCVKSCLQPSQLCLYICRFFNL